MKRRVALLWLTALPIASLTADEFAPVLSTNPFERPAWLTDAQELPATAPRVEARPRLDLRATLSAGKQSSVNVGGKIIGLGEQIGGYTLVSVTEGVAEFRDGDQIISVALSSFKDKENAD